VPDGVTRRFLRQNGGGFVNYQYWKRRGRRGCPSILNGSGDKGEMILTIVRPTADLILSVVPAQCN
jgi:hypothetical protein